MIFILGMVCGILIATTFALLEIWVLTVHSKTLLFHGAKQIVDEVKKEHGEVSMPDETEDNIRVLFGDIPERDV